MSNSRPARRNAPLGALCLCASLLSLGIGQAAGAGAPTRSANFAHDVPTMPPAPVRSNAVGPRAARAHKVAHQGPSSGWINIGLATDANGNSVSVWGHLPDGTMAEWAYDTNDTATVQGPTYGPYTDNNGNTWAPYAVGINPTNDHAKILWDRSDGAAGIWTMDTSGNAVTVGPTFGPYDGWTAIGIATASDGSTNMLWARNDGAMSEWVLDGNGNILGQGPTYGPYSDNVNGTAQTWFPVEIGTNPDDYTARVVWERSDGLVGTWIMDANANYVSGGNNTYGPYSDDVNGTTFNWNPVAIATANDGTSALLWARDDGAGGVWSLDANVNVANVGPTYGPYSDGGGTWAPSLYYGGLGIDPSDDTPRVLWNRSDGAAGLWSLDASGNQAVVGSVYGPYY